MIRNKQDIDIFYMKMAYLISERATCIRRSVGSVIVRDKIVLSTGYNGAPSKIEHCTEKTCIRKLLNIPSGEQLDKCITGNTVIKLLNGTYKTIKELADIGEDFWVYSIDINTGKIVPGLATNPHLTGHRNDIVEITFDNGKTLQCTSDHKILLRDCTYKQAKDLIYGDSCMPIYYNRGTNNDKHEVIQNIRKGSINIKWDPQWKCNSSSIKTHEMVYRNIHNYSDVLGKNEKDIHHKDSNKYNNCPDNLNLLTKSEHMQIHGGFANLDKDELKKVSLKGSNRVKELCKIDSAFKKKLSDGGKRSMQNNWNNPEWKERALIRCKENSKKRNEKSNKSAFAIEQRKKDKILKGLSFLIFKCNENNEVIVENNYRELSLQYAPKYKLGEKGSMPPKLEKILNFYNSLQEALDEAKYYNHKVINIKHLDEKQIPVYDLSVLGYENFAIDLGDNSCVVISNCVGSHSEMNAISQAAKNGVNIDNSTIYCTTQPCTYCAKSIVNAGIKRLVYCESYGKGLDDLTRKILQNIKIDIIPKEEIFSKENIDG